MNIDFYILVCKIYLISKEEINLSFLNFFEINIDYGNIIKSTKLI